MNKEEIKEFVLTYYSNNDYPCCNKCGYTDIRALCLDHVNSDGNLHRKKGGKKGINLYKELYKHDFITEYEFQVLCSNCNMIKFFENNESSHTKTKQWRENISKSLKGKILPKGKFSNRAIKVAQYDLNMNFIKVWDCIKDAESFYNSNPKSKNIVAVCNNRQKTAYGFIWKHYNN